MARKLMVNNTQYEINGNLTVRAGDTPGKDLDTVHFSIPAGPGTKQFVDYGNDQNPYVDQLEISGMTDGAMVISDQVIMIRGGQMDNMFNMNDTIYIALDGQSFEIKSGNTWT